MIFAVLSYDFALTLGCKLASFYHFILCIMSKRSGMDHTVLRASTVCLPFLRKRSPDGATRN